MKFLITADWQIAFSNLEYSKRAHDQEMSIIDKYNIFGHIDLGDQKDDYNPIDGRVADFALARAKAIQAVCTNALRLLGNHDRYGQSNDANNWMSMFDLVGGCNITKPEVVGNNPSFFCLPYRKDADGTIAAATELYKKLRKSKSKRNILLFHNDVRGTSYDNVQNKESTSHITLAKLHTSDYDMCFGGHIHKRQWLSKNTMYVGNPFATDMGEINQRKGFIVYDDAANTTKFIPSKVPGLFSWRYADKHFKKVPEGTRIKEVVKCDAKENYHEKLNKIADAIEKKFPLAIPYVLPKFISKETQEEIIVDPNSSDYHKIKSYVMATADKAIYNRPVMVEYLASVLYKVEGTSVSRHTGKIIFDSITARNVLSFDRLKFNYRNRGVMLVKGNNKDARSFNSIGSGKTNFLSMPSIALFGQTFKSQKNDAWASDANDDKATVTLKMHNDIGSSVSIIRSRRPGKLRMIVNNKDESTGLRNNTKKATQGQLAQFIGYTFDTFYKSVYIDQSLSNAFLNGTNKDRSNLIHQFQNLERFAQAKQIVSKELSVLAQRRNDIETEVEITANTLAEINDDINARSATQTESISSLKKQFLVAKKLYKYFHKTSTSNLRKHERRIRTLTKIKDSVSRKLEQANASVVQASNNADNIEEEIKAIEHLKECQVCRQPVAKSHRRNIANSLKLSVKKQHRIEERASKERISLRKEFVEVRKSIAYLEDKVNVIKGNALKLERLLDSKLSAYEAVKKTSSKEQESIGKARARYKHTKAMLKATRTTLKHYDDDRKFLEFAMNAFSRDGLPAFLSNLVIPVLNIAAERYSKLFIDGEIQVVFDLEKGQIIPRIVNAHGGKSLQAQSTGEKAWAGIITSFALREISHPTNLLILDEPGHGLDSESAKTFGKNLLKLKSLFETVLVVTHDPSISSALEGENTVTVTKSSKISTLN